ncbi:MAG: glycerol kinase GlpK [Coriobacteriales bacterium]|nr:glycerol kinase GlpK [Coriobacteriales bacterium]
MGDLFNRDRKYVLALDQGTTSSRSILFDHASRPRYVAQMEFTQHFPQPGWVEHDPKDILATQVQTIHDVIDKAHIEPSDIVAIGITNQRETTVVWNRKTGQPVYNAIVWQCRRTASMIDDLVERGFGPMIKEKTGLVPDAYFSASKVAWILQNVPGAREAADAGDLLFGTVDCWLVWNLTGGLVHATDYTNASRTMLFNIHEGKWDPELLELFGVPASMMPQVLDCAADYGATSEIALPGAGGIPIRGVMGDQQAALFGQCCFKKGEVKNTYGTGCFLLMNTGEEAVAAQHGLVTTIASCLDGKISYALEGSVFVAGALIQWLRDEMGFMRKASDSLKMARSVPDSGGVYIVPAFTGLGAPYWDQYARGAIYGLTRGTTKEHLVRAALEALAYQSYDVICAMSQDAGVPLNHLKVDGGASANDFLMQFQSDILGAQVLRPKTLETTALGAAYLAGLEVGFWASQDELEAEWHGDKPFLPNQMDADTRAKLLAGWADAVKRTRSGV